MIGDMKKAKITHEDESVTIEKDGKKYVVFFDKVDFGIFVENDEVGSFVVVPASLQHGHLEYWPNW